MSLPRDVLARIPDEGDAVGLRMRLANERRDFFFLILEKEGPVDLFEHSLGAASAQAVAGTGWDEVQDASNRYPLEPEFTRYLYQAFWGVTPSIARVYMQYPSGNDMLSLLGTRRVGTDSIGWIDGLKSPAHSPSLQTELWTTKGTHPAFNGYHPYLEPASITVRLNFYITKFWVDFIGARVPTRTVPQDIRGMANRVFFRTMGGIFPMEAPDWLR